MTVLASAAAAGLVRTFIKSRLHNWDCTHISDDARLIATEMVANAVAATPGEEIRFRLSSDTGGVLLAVWDSSDHPPALTPIAELTLGSLDTSEEHWDDNGGWGLPIIAALAADCGHQPDPSGGKWVWARIRP